MNNVIEKILKDITNNKSEIFELQVKHETKITKDLFKLLSWNSDKKSYNGLFGWGSHRTDGSIEIDNTLVIIEVKTVKPKGRDGYEFNYFHALSQGLIYSYQQQCVAPGRKFLVLCIILDWGRAARRELNDDERRFLDKVRNDRIRFLRVSMSNKKFIEHNMNTKWAIIK